MKMATFLLSLIVFLPALGALILVLCPGTVDEEQQDRRNDLFRITTLVITIAVFALAIFTFFGLPETSFDSSAGEMQDVFYASWIPSFNIDYFMGIDGISLPLIMLTALISMLAMAASWSIKKHVKGYCILFLLLETGMLGVFLSLDFFLFYVFWEVMLLPMYFLIGIWGGPRREYAAIKFFLFTLVGSVLILVAILMLYFKSDLVELAKVTNVRPAVAEAGELIDPDQEKKSEIWRKCHISSSAREKTLVGLEMDSKTGDHQAVHTFNLLALAAMGQHTDLFSPTWQRWAFLLLLIGFIIKVPSVPFHTWLPDAHVEAPTPISMILAGVLLKMGGYGIIRICYPICPHGGYDLAWLVCGLGVVSMVYGAFAALAQTDFKRMVAYSSVSHMGYVMLGLGVWSASSPEYITDYWTQGVTGAMFQMIGHGISSAGMFFMVGILYDRVHHRNLNEFGGIYGKMPFYTAMAIGLFFAGLGLPGLCGFIGEIMVVFSVWKYSILLAVIAASVVILTAGYILWCIQRVYLGAEYLGPHEEELTPCTTREKTIGCILLSLAILFGVFPYQTVIRFMEKTIEQQVQDLSDWTENVKERPALEEEGGLDDGQTAPDETPQETPKGDSTAAVGGRSPPGEVALAIPNRTDHQEDAGRWTARAP
jgi:NADH-quinone oxidoreductase subunit M